MARLTLNLLGTVAAYLDGEPISSFRSRKVQALLIYLVTEAAQNPGHKSTRESLMSLLWPDFHPQSARTNLRQALSQLRKAIPSVPARRGVTEVPFILADRQAVQINPEAAYSLDLAAYGQGQSAEPSLTELAAAVDLYRGSFLADFYVPDSAAFEAWANDYRAILQEQQLAALQRLADHWLDVPDYERAIVYAQRQLAIDDLREPAYGQLMMALNGLGRRAEALKLYDECSRRLVEALAVQAGPQLTAIYEQIRTDERARAKRRPPPVRSVEPVSRPEFLEPGSPEESGAGPLFVARESELADLLAHLEAALNGQGQVVFVAGDAGRGKSALLAALAHEAQAKQPDLLVASGICDAYSGIGDPYLPFREMLSMLSGDLARHWSAGAISRIQAQRLWQAAPLVIRALVDHGPHLVNTFVPVAALLDRAGSIAGETAAWLPDLQNVVARSQKGAEVPGRDSVFQQFSNVLAAIAAAQPLLLLLDDMQWADEASISLLFHLGRRLKGRQILIICTYRPDEVAIGREGTPHPMAKVIAELQRLNGKAVLDLSLGEAGRGRHFVDAFLAEQPNRLDEAFREALTSHTGGHPLFTVELWQSLQEGGAIYQDERGEWVARSELDWRQLPMRVEALIGERINRLAEELREILTVASVEGEQFTAQTVARIQQIGERQLLRTLSRELEVRHRLVRSEGEVAVGEHYLSRFRFSHALFQRYLYNGLSPGESRLLHREIGQVLERLYEDKTETIAPQLARHFTLGGDKVRACAYHLTAGAAALQSYAWTEAIYHYQQGLELAPIAASRAQLLAGLGRALLRQSRPGDAVPPLQEAAALIQKMAFVQFADLAMVYADLAMATLGVEDVPRALAIAEKGLAALVSSDDSPAKCQLLLTKGSLHMRAGQAQQAANLADRAYEMARRLGDLELQIAAVANFGASEAESKEDYASKLAEVSASLESHEQPLGLLSEIELIWIKANRARHPAQQRAHHHQASQLQRQIGIIPQYTLPNAILASLNLGDLTWAAAKLEELHRLVAEGVDLPWSLYATVSSVEGILALFRGQWDVAIQLLRTTYAEATRRGHENMAEIFGYFLAFALVEHSRWSGKRAADHLSEAETILVETITRAVGYELQARSCLVRLLLGEQRVDEARQQIESGRLFASENAAKEMLAVLWLAEAQLAITERRWSAAQTALQLADDGYAALSMGWARARLRLDWAELYRGRGSAGDLEAARANLAEAVTVFAAIGAPGYKALVQEWLTHLSDSPDI